MKPYETILTETIGEHLLKVTLNRPEVGNAKNTQMGLDLLDLWTGLIDDPGDIRCVILTGAGERIFCAGGDLKQRRDLTPKQWQHQHEIFERGRDALLDMPGTGDRCRSTATPMPAGWRPCWSATSPTPCHSPGSR